MRHRRPLPEPVLRHLADRATDYGLSRRAFLGLLGAAGGASVLGGCVVGDDPVSARGQGGMSGYLRWANWEYYLDKDDDGSSPTLTQFREETGIDVLYYEDIDDLDTFYHKISGRLNNRQDIGYDLITLSDWCVKQWSDRADLATLDRAAMPKTQTNLMDGWDGLYFDPDLKYSIPWQRGITVVAWNKEAVPNGITSVDELWADEYHGKVAVVAEMRETLGPIMRSQGTDPAGDWGDTEFDKALAMLRTQIDKGQIMSVKGGDMVSFLKEGKAQVGIGYGGDIAFESDTCGYTVPAEGATYWIDNLVAPATTNQVDSVQRLIDFYYDPEVAAAVSAYTYYATPVKGAREAMETVAPDEVDNDMIFPSTEMLDRLSLFRELSPEESARYGQQFKDLVQYL